MTQPDSSAATSAPNCPKCQGSMWDNREGKRNPKAPDFKCKDKSCDGIIWPPRGAAAAAPAPTAAATATAAPGVVADGMPACPICGGPMWDDRLSKRNPKAPDFKCKNKPKERGGPGCEGIIWPPRDGKPSPYPAPQAGRPASRQSAPPPRDEAPPPDDRDAPAFDDDDLPF
ncbi:MAG: hypothetical protein ABJD07_01060 [Gemmatimonadaceae bacterium]